MPVSVLDPFEVFEIAVWPAPQFEGVSPKDKVGAAPAKAHLGALERLITADAVANSRFKAILNEKDPPPGRLEVEAARDHTGSLTR